LPKRSALLPLVHSGAEHGRKVAAPDQPRFMWDQNCEGNPYNEACLLPDAFSIQAAQQSNAAL